MDEGKNSRINSKEMKTFNKRFPSIISRSYQTATERKRVTKTYFRILLKNSASLWPTPTKRTGGFVIQVHETPVFIDPEKEQRRFVRFRSKNGKKG